MKYRKDHVSGNELSALGFGCMRFPRNLAKFDFEKSEKLICAAIERGVNYFDTAYIYGNSEEVLGNILEKNNLREKIYIATKLPHMKVETRDDLDRIFEEQRARLRTDYIDYYLVHNIATVAQWERLQERGFSDWVAEKKAAGQIRSIGFSFHGEQDQFMKLLDVYDWELTQIQYNYVNVNYQAGMEGLKKAAEKGISVVIMEPLLGGKLANGLPKKAVELFRRQDDSWTPTQWALRWLLNQSEPTVILSGMNADEQITDNIAVTDATEPNSLSEDEKSVFEPVMKAFSESFKVPCTGCNYCMPCPHKVNIPACFSAYNMSYATGFVSGMQQYITSTGLIDPESNSGFSNCTKCGLCETKCPQHIKITYEGKRAARRMEPFWIRGALKIVMKFM